MKYILILAFFFLLGQAYAQQKTIYVLNNRYNEHVNEFINKSPTFKPYRILVNYQIVDADDSRLIDYARVEGWVKKYFPHKNDEGVLCIDLENELYQHLKTKHPNSREYKRAVDEFVKLVTFIKQKRPKLTVGIWGLLFPESTQKLDAIFEVADMLFPYSYLPAPAGASGMNANLHYLQGQLDIAFSFADRLNKPVVPFLWYLTHGPDKTLRREQIPKEEMFEYIKYIENYRSSAGLEVLGIAWWDTPTPYSRNSIKKNFLNGKEIATRNLTTKSATIDETFLYYFGSGYSK